MTDRRESGQRLPDAEVHHGWVRIDEGHMGLPVPAVTMPTADLYQPDLAALGFDLTVWWSTSAAPGGIVADTGRYTKPATRSEVGPQDRTLTVWGQ